jgi:hypothetical protein
VEPLWLPALSKLHLPLPLHLPIRSATEINATTVSTESFSNKCCNYHSCYCLAPSHAAQRAILQESESTTKMTGCNCSLQWAAQSLSQFLTLDQDYHQVPYPGNPDKKIRKHSQPPCLKGKRASLGADIAVACMRDAISANRDRLLSWAADRLRFD